jgi:maleate isomerase
MGERSRRRGIGVVVPFDFALDREMWRWAPPDVDLFVTRTRYLPLRADLEMAEQIGSDEALRTGTHDVLAAEPDVVLYLCTSGSFVRGVGGERHMREVMLAAGAPAAVTTSGALLDALTHLGVWTVSVVSPYLPAVAARLDGFLAEAGVRVVAHRGLGLDEHIFRVPGTTVHDLVMTTAGDSADAVFVSCTNLACYDVIAELEATLGKPVLTANQVSLWAAVRRAGAAVPRNGQRLFAAGQVSPNPGAASSAHGR